MKQITLLALALLTLGLAGTASAQTPVIRISGAATFRSPVQKGIDDILNTGFTVAYAGPSRFRATASIYSGTLKSNNAAVIIKTYWTGDVSGVVALATDTKISTWMDNTVLSSATVTPGTQVTTYTPETPTTADVTISVSDANSSAAVASTAGAAGTTAADAIVNAGFVNAGSANKAGGAGKVGMVGFQWVLGRLASGFTVPFTNITQAQAAALISRPTPVSFFTGLAADKNKYVFAVGRSEDAGARTVPFAEAQLGFYTPPLQYQLTFSGSTTAQADGLATGGSAATVTGLFLWPANSPLNAAPTLNWQSAGHSGYNLTSDLTNVLSATNPVSISSLAIGNASNPTLPPTGITHAYFVGYNAVADTANLVSAGGTALTYNGVAYSEAAVKSGQYSLWSYAHVYYIGTGARALTGTKQKAADDLADIVWQVDATANTLGQTGTTSGAGIVLDPTTVLVGRDVEGGVTYQTY